MLVVVVSDSLADLPKAVARLEECGHEVEWVRGLTPSPRWRRAGWPISLAPMLS